MDIGERGEVLRRTRVVVGAAEEAQGPLILAVT